MEEYKTDLTEEQLNKMISDMMGQAVDIRGPMSIVRHEGSDTLWCLKDVSGGVFSIFGERYKNELEKAFEQAIKDELSK